MLTCYYVHFSSVMKFVLALLSVTDFLTDGKQLDSPRRNERLSLVSLLYVNAFIGQSPSFLEI